MKATISWWNLDQSAQTVDTLRAYLTQEGVAPWEGVRGMHSKFWIADRERNLWGAVVLWESAEAMSQPLPPNRAAQLIGYPATSRITFDVEVLIEDHRAGQWLAEAASRKEHASTHLIGSPT